MGRYRVLLGWTDAEGEHAVGDTVERVTRNPAEEVELGLLIEYGVIEPATEETASPPSRAKKR